MRYDTPFLSNSQRAQIDLLRAENCLSSPQILHSLDRNRVRTPEINGDPREMDVLSSHPNRRLRLLR